MRKKNLLFGVIILIVLVAFFQCEKQEIIDDVDFMDDNKKSSSLLKVVAPTGEIAGNNLSYPVIWSDGVSKVLRGEPGMIPILDGEWWYCWGAEAAEPTDPTYSCLPDPDNELYCDDGVAGTYDETNVPGDDWLKAYLQKDINNVWQAGTFDGSAEPVNVDFVDWGDNLESVDWYTKSQVRTEVVLFKTLDPAMLEYSMRHVSGWGIEEVHGLAVSQGGEIIEGAGLQSTIYSGCARLTIQKLLVDRDDPNLANLVWIPNEGWSENETYEGDLVNNPIFNLAVYESEDGPGYYNAEINVKGKVIYGYTWNVRQLNDRTENGGEAAGCYRITFSFDENGPAVLNTFFTDGTTEILLPLEEEVTTKSGETEGGGTAVLDFANNLTYIDVNILEKSGGGSRPSK